MTERELAFIAKALAKQGFYIEQTRHGAYWLIRAPTEEVVAFLSEDADELVWDETLVNLRQRQLIIWPPYY